MRWYAPLLPCLAFLLLPLVAQAQTREWTDSEGRSFEGRLINYDESFVRIERKSDKRTFKLQRDQLSSGDNVYLDEITRKKRLEALLEGVPDNYDKTYDATIKEEVPAIVFYRNGMSYSEFDQLLEKLVADPKFNELIKDRAVLAVIREKDNTYENAVGNYTSYTDRPLYTIMQEFKVYANVGFRDMETEAFLKEIDTKLTEVENRVD